MRYHVLQTYVVADVLCRVRVTPNLLNKYKNLAIFCSCHGQSLTTVNHLLITAQSFSHFFYPEKYSLCLVSPFICFPTTATASNSIHFVSRSKFVHWRGISIIEKPRIIILMKFIPSSLTKRYQICIYPSKTKISLFTILLAYIIKLVVFERNIYI